MSLFYVTIPLNRLSYKIWLAQRLVFAHVIRQAVMPGVSNQSILTIRMPVEIKKFLSDTSPLCKAIYVLIEHSIM